MTPLLPGKRRNCDEIRMLRYRIEVISTWQASARRDWLLSSLQAQLTKEAVDA